MVVGKIFGTPGLRWQRDWPQSPSPCVFLGQICSF